MVLAIAIIAVIFIWCCGIVGVWFTSRSWPKIEEQSDMDYWLKKAAKSDYLNQ